MQYFIFFLFPAVIKGLLRYKHHKNKKKVNAPYHLQVIFYLSMIVFYSI